MDSLVGYGSDEENETERYDHPSSGSRGVSGSRRRDDDTNYDDVNMDMSEDSQEQDSDAELPPVDASSSRYRSDRHRDRDGHIRRDSRSDDSEKRSDRREICRDSSPRQHRNDRERRSPRRDDRSGRSERTCFDSGSSSRRGLLGDKPDNKFDSKGPPPALMDLKPFGNTSPPASHSSGSSKSHDTRDAVSPRFVDRDRRDRDKDRERDRERDRHSRPSEERRNWSRHTDRRSRSPRRDHRSRPYPEHSSNDRRGSPANEYRPSYKVNKKLEVIEKMGLQIKTPDGSMATAQQLRQATIEKPTGLPSYYNPNTVNANKIMEQVQKRKLLWSNKAKAATAETSSTGAWTGTKFAQDNDGKQAVKFMRLMGIKEPEAVPNVPEKAADPIKKQEEMFQAMQAQYDVARATTHTMRGVGLGFQRGQF